MKIDNNNIEEYIFDYLEGNLSGQELTDFKSYINSNPEANSEMQLWKQSYVGNNSSTVSSTEFSSLKKSYKGYYWAGGVAAAFLLGVVTMAVIQENPTINTAPQNSEKQVEINSSSIISDEIISKEIIVEDEAIQGNPEIYNTPVSEKISIVEVAEIEEMEFASNREVNMDSSESNREVSGAIKVEKVTEESTKKKTNKEVDVIELNSEGF